MIYGVRQIKVCKTQYRPFAGVLQDFLRISFKKIHLCRSHFFDKWTLTKFYEQLFIEHLRMTATENKRRYAF